VLVKPDAEAGDVAAMIAQLRNAELFLVCGIILARLVVEAESQYEATAFLKQPGSSV
jgi:hypothetical protein